VNSDAGILDRELSHLVAVADPKRHLTRIGEFNRVGEEIDEDLAQPVLIRVDHPRQPLPSDVAKLDAFGHRLQAEHIDELIEKLIDVHLIAAEMKSTGLDLGDIEKPVDQAERCSALRRTTLIWLILAAGIAGSRASNCV